jgi:UDP-glucose:(heptosyl)LPS alpha-1,3-glucosyltransferase
MKFAFALYKYFPYGGLQRDLLHIAEEARLRGHKVTVYCYDWSGPKPDAITVKILPAKGATNHKRNKSFCSNLKATLKKDTPDRLVAFDRIPDSDFYYAADTCFKAKLYNERPWFYRLLPRYRNFLQQEAAIFNRGNSTAILGLARAALDEYQQYYQTEERRFHLLPPGINQACINEANKRNRLIQTELGLSETDRMLLFVGSGFRTKGLDRAIAALASTGLETCHLVIAGQDNEATYQAQAKQAGLASRVHFLGGRDDIPTLLKSADILLHPARRENTGTVLLEAAVACLPVICSAACGYSQYIQDHQLGKVLSAPFNQHDFEQSIKELLFSDELLASTRTKCADFARQADIYSLYKKAVDIIEAT